MRQTLAALALGATGVVGLAGFSEQTQQYAVTYTLTEGGAPRLSGEVLLREGAEAQAQHVNAEVIYRFKARLSPSGERLALDAELQRAGVPIGLPAVTFARGGEARMIVGGEDEQRWVIEIAPAE